MGDELKKVQILLEEIKGDVKAADDGHAHLNRKIETEIGNLRKENNEQFSDIKIAFNGLKSDVTELKSDVVELKSDSKEQKEILKDIQHDLKSH